MRTLTCRTFMLILLVVLFGFGCQTVPKGDVPHIELRDASSAPIEGWTEMTPRKDDRRTIWVAPEATLTSEDITLARRTTDNLGRLAVSLDLTDVGAAKMEALSIETIGEPVAIFLDDALISAPVVSSPLSRRIIITGVTESEVDRIVRAFSRR